VNAAFRVFSDARRNGEVITMAKQLLALIGSLLPGLVYFMLLMGASQAFVALNASVSPDIPWFPLPALALVWIVTLVIRRRWEIRLSHPVGVPWRAAYAFALLTTYAAVCLSVLEAWFHDLVRPAPVWPNADVSAAFQLTFLVVLPFIAAVLAEIGYRGMIQTRLEKLLPIWPMLLLIAIINALMHFYDPDQASQWLRFIALNLAFGYITWRCQSILPALAAHVTMNLFEPLSRYGSDPVRFGEFAAGTLAAFAATGLAALAMAIYIGRSLPQPEKLRRDPE